MRSALAGQAGFTLVELLVAMLVSIIVLGGGTYGLALAFRQTTEISDRVQNTSNAEVGLQRLTDDLRQALPCPVGLVTGAGQSLSGGLYVGSGPVISMCDPTPGPHSSQPPAEALVTWTCSTGANAPSIPGTSFSAGSCTRTWSTITVTNATTASASATGTVTTRIYGVATLTLTGMTGSGSGTSVGSLSPALYSLSNASGLSYVGIQGSFYNLTDPANPGDASNTDIARKTAAIPLTTGASLRNADT